MTNSKKANGLFLTMTVCIICFYLFGKGLVTGLPVSIRLISSEIVYLIPVLLCLLIGRDSIGKLIPHRAPRISTLLMTILFVLLLEPLMTCLNVFTMLFSTNYVLETRSDLSIISVPLQLICIAVVPAVLEEFMFRGVFAGYYREKGILTAALLSGLVFGLFHLNFNQFGYAFALGVASPFFWKEPAVFFMECLPIFSSMASASSSQRFPIRFCLSPERRASQRWQRA